MFIIKSDFSDVYKELDRLEAMPTPRMVAGLETVLEVGFETARANVHVDTGKLKATGKKTSKTNTNDWKGQFSFPARNEEGTPYGIYERARGGAHDFLNQVFLLDNLFRSAIKNGLRRT